jgi:LysR family carnitine catabolism transcriptional activator
MRTNASLRQLEVFLLVSQSKSFSDAARALRLTPSALSRTVSQLENTLGVRLFDRHTRAFVPTAEGAEFLITARRVLEEFDRGLDLFNQFVGGQRGQVNVAVMPSVAVSVLAPLISRFEQRQPEAEILIYDAIAGGAFRAVLEGRADFGITCSLQSNDDIRAEPLITDGFFVLCNSDHPLARQKAVTWKDLAAHRYIGSAPESSVRYYTDAAFLQAGVKVRNHYEPVGLPSIVSLVKQGLGITALPGLVLPIVEAQGLIFRPLTAPKMVRQICLLTKISRPQSPLACAFAALVQKEIRGGFLDAKFGQHAWSCQGDTPVQKNLHRLRKA